MIITWGCLAMNKHADFRMLTINEAAEYFCLPKHFIRQLVLKKTIPSVMAGNKYLINEKVMESYLKNGSNHQATN